MGWLYRCLVEMYVEEVIVTDEMRVLNFRSRLKDAFDGLDCESPRISNCGSSCFAAIP